MTPLPWQPGQQSVMLAPMQGVTNPALRQVLVDWVRPDVVWTEFVQVGTTGRKPLRARDIAQLQSGADSGVPLVVQLIGHQPETMALAATVLVEAGARHLNINCGCPYGRMLRGKAGGALLQTPELLLEIVRQVRARVPGSLSVKLRAGYSDSRQVFALLPALVDSGIDYLVLHPRTVVQRYDGVADHALSRELAALSPVPIIANGDLTAVAPMRELLESAPLAGVMIGRAALRDPLLFRRLREGDTAPPDAARRRQALAEFLQRLLPPFRDIYCGEQQALGKLKDVLHVGFFGPAKERVRPLLRAKSLAELERELRRYVEG